MKKNRIAAFATALAWTSLTGTAAWSAAPQAPSKEEAIRIAAEAYEYAYPLYATYKSRNASAFTDGQTPLFNKLYYRARLVEAKDSVPLGPNNDTPYFFGLLDLSREPVVVHVPDHGSRYFSLNTWDAYGENQPYIGTRATGGREGRYLLAGPGFKGKAPEGVRLLRFSTPFAYVLGRTLVHGAADLPEVIKLEQAINLTPLSQWPAQEGKYAGGERKDLPAFSPEADSFFVVANNALAQNPPPARDKNLLARFRKIGVGPGEKWDWNRFDEATRSEIRQRLREEDAQLAGLIKSNYVAANHKWERTIPNLGKYGSDYHQRAVVARTGFIGGNSQEEAIYYQADNDGQGIPLDGKGKYILHFKKGGLPPVKGFWSITLYSLPNLYLVRNPLNRYSFGSRNPAFRTNADGSVDFYVQSDCPGKDKEANWLPAPPAGPFTLMIRAYIPEAPALTSRYELPLIAPSQG